MQSNTHATDRLDYMKKIAKDWYFSSNEKRFFVGGKIIYSVINDVKLSFDTLLSLFLRH